MEGEELEEGAEGRGDGEPAAGWVGGGHGDFLDGNLLSPRYSLRLHWEDGRGGRPRRGPGACRAKGPFLNGRTEEPGRKDATPAVVGMRRQVKGLSNRGPKGWEASAQKLAGCLSQSFINAEKEGGEK